MPLKTIRQLYRLLSSKVFLLWIIGGWIVYYVISAIWVKEAFGAFMMGLREKLIMQIPFVLFLMSGLLNLMRSAGVVFRKSKIQFFIWLILPVGALLFFSGFFMSSTMRESGQRFVGEGDLIDPPWIKEQYRIIRIDPGLKDHLTDGDAASEIFAYEPTLTIMDKSSRTLDVGAFPPAKFQNTYFHILNFGIAPGVRLFKQNRIVNEGYMILRIITPGSSDFFEIPPYPYRFLVSMEPEKTVLQEQTRTSLFNLKDPVFRVRAMEGEKVLAEGDPREGLKINDLTLYFFKPTFWVQLEAVKDPGVSVMHIGVILIALGIPLYLFMLGVNAVRRNII